MGLFDQFKQAMTGDNIRRGFEGAAQSMQDMAANPSHILKDPAAGNAYGQEARRLQKQGILGSGVIVSVTPTGEVAVAGVDWATIEVSVTVPGRERYIAVERHMVPRITADMYAPGTRHTIAVDPANPNHFAFAE